MVTPELKRLVRETLPHVTYSTKRGVFIYKRSFFYRFGTNEEKVAKSVVSRLSSVGLRVQIVSMEEKWNQWPKNSWWQIEFKVD